MTSRVQTGRNLHDRVKEHKYAVKKDLRNGVAAHAWKTQYVVNWSLAKGASLQEEDARGN